MISDMKAITYISWDDEGTWDSTQKNFAFFRTLRQTVIHTPDNQPTGKSHGAKLRKSLLGESGHPGIGLPLLVEESRVWNDGNKLETSLELEIQRALA